MPIDNGRQSVLYRESDCMCSEAKRWGMHGACRLWCLGVLLLLLSVLTAFVGYVLPWGQMSFWGATVITRIASALPVVG